MTVSGICDKERGHVGSSGLVSVTKKKKNVERVSDQWVRYLLTRTNVEGRALCARAVLPCRLHRVFIRTTRVDLHVSFRGNST